MKNPDRSWLDTWDGMLGVYVIRCVVAGVVWYYVGSSAKLPKDRLYDHLHGYNHSRFVMRYGVSLARSMMRGPSFKRISTRTMVEIAERKVARVLRGKGYNVRQG